MSYEVKGKIIRTKGSCNANHKVGEKFDFSGFRCPNLCGDFYHNIFYVMQAMKYGADIDWLKDKNVAVLVCPDDKNQVTIELRRGKKLG